eukprot:1904-Heterococcus_DN1.PRE.6
MGADDAQAALQQLEQQSASSGSSSGGSLRVSATTLDDVYYPLIAQKGKTAPSAARVEHIAQTQHSECLLLLEFIPHPLNLTVHACAHILSEVELTNTALYCTSKRVPVCSTSHSIARPMLCVVAHGALIDAASKQCALDTARMIENTATVWQKHKHFKASLSVCCALRIASSVCCTMSNTAKRLDIVHCFLYDTSVRKGAATAQSPAVNMIDMAAACSNDASVLIWHLKLLHLTHSGLLHNAMLSMSLRCVFCASHSVMKCMLLNGLAAKYGLHAVV